MNYTEPNIVKRTLALKSLIMFGEYSRYTVNDLIIMRKFRFLIQLYYACSKIDFNQEVKDVLKISKEREIVKPGKNNGMLKLLWNDFFKELYTEENKENKVHSIIFNRALNRIKKDGIRNEEINNTYSNRNRAGHTKNGFNRNHKPF